MQTPYNRRLQMHWVTASVFIALVILVIVFNAWTGASLGLLSLLLITEIIYAFPAAFLMPWHVYCIATTVVVVAACSTALSQASKESLLLRITDSVVLIVIAILAGVFFSVRNRQCTIYSLAPTSQRSHNGQTSHLGAGNYPS